MSNQQESRAGSEVPATANPSHLAVDAHGFIADDYKWVPVRRRPRRDGWSPRKMVAFIQALADTGCVSLAAKEAGMSARSAYALRRAPGAEKFAAAWDAAIGQAAHLLVDAAFDRALNGTVTPIFNREGACLGQKVTHNDRLLMFLMRAHFPERYRTAHANFRSPSEPLPAPPEPVARSIETLQPVAPPAPHALLDEDELEHELLLADLAEGELPHFYDDIPTDVRDDGDNGPSDAFVAPPEEGDDDPALREPPIPFHPLPPQPAAIAHYPDEDDEDDDEEGDDDDYDYEDEEDGDWDEDEDDPDADDDGEEEEEDPDDHYLDEEDEDASDSPCARHRRDPDDGADADDDEDRAMAGLVARLARGIREVIAEREASDGAG